MESQPLTAQIPTCCADWCIGTLPTAIYIVAITEAYFASCVYVAPVVAIKWSLFSTYIHSCDSRSSKLYIAATTTGALPPTYIHCSQAGTNSPTAVCAPYQLEQVIYDVRLVLFILYIFHLGLLLSFLSLRTVIILYLLPDVCLVSH